MKILLDSELSKEKSSSYTKEEIKSLGTQHFITELFSTMLEYNGVGIAAPQVSVLKRIICVHVSYFSEIMFNPVILKRSGKTTTQEGCLSFPGIYKDITRSTKITVKWLDRTAKVRYQELEGIAATVVQHEIDHLDGRTFMENE